MIFTSRIIFASQEHIRMDDPIYLFLDRMATLGYLPNLLNDTRPYTRDKVAAQLKILESVKPQLAKVDQKILDEYIADYRLELQPDKKHFLLGDDDSYFFFRSLQNMKTGLKTMFQYADNREKQHLFVYEKDGETIWIDWSEALRAESKNGSYRPLNRDEIRFFAQLGKQFSMYFDGIRFVQYNVNNYTEPSDDFKGGFINDPKAEKISLRGYDFSDAYIQMAGQYGRFSLGTEPIFWGNSPNSLILSDNVAPFPFFSWQKEFKRAQFTFFHGSLLPANFEQDTLTGEKTYLKKYIVGHRWDLAINPKLNFSFTEIYLYGDRDMELAYLVPPVILWPTQHNLMDRDNATMAFEFEYFPRAGTKFYGTLFLDEFTTTQIFNDYWANKQGVQLGVQYALSKLPTDFRIEFTAVHPWTYTHKFSYSSYTHNGVDLGFYAGPNSQLWFVENQWWPGKRLYASLQYRLLKHGVEPLAETDKDYYPVGGDANQNYNDRNLDLDHKTTWLMGDIQDINEIGLQLSYRWRKEIIFDWRFKLIELDGKLDRYFTFQARFDY